MKNDYLELAQQARRAIQRLIAGQPRPPEGRAASRQAAQPLRARSAGGLARERNLVPLGKLSEGERRL